MLDSIKILNVDTQKEIEISKEYNGKYVLDSIDWDVPAIEQETYRVPFQIGKTLEGMTIGTRKPSIVGYVIADTENINPSGKTWNEYLEEQQEQINDNKEELDKVISIYQDVLIKAGDFYILARPTQPPKYSSDETENSEVYCIFTLEVECYNPLFYKDIKHVNLSHVDGLFHFPLILTEDKKDEYVVFGEIMKRQSVPIENNGDVDVGCTIVIRANGGVVRTPSVYNVNTGEKISFYDLDLEDGDYITINTEIGEESIILHKSDTGEETSIIGNMNVESTLFRIKRGVYYYSYEVDEQYKNNLEMYIEYTERYYNIRGM